MKRLILLFALSLPVFGQGMFFNTNYAPAVPCDTPTDSPGAGTYSSTQTPTLSAACTSICFTTDGSTPTAPTPGTCGTGTTYSGAITVAATTTIKAISTQSGHANSGVLSSLYTITAPTNIGDTTVEATAFNDNTVVLWQQATTGANGPGYAVNSCSIYIATAGTAPNSVSCAVYTRDGGTLHPSTRLCSASGAQGTVPGWTTLTLTGCGTLSASTTYFLGVGTQANGTVTRHLNGDTSTFYNATPWASLWPASYSSVSGAWAKTSVYITVTAQ